MNLESRLRRFEQQLAAFEDMHAGDLKGFEAKLETYVRLQADEIKFLREELAALRQELAAREEEVEPASPTIHSQNQAQPSADQADKPEVQLNRREFLSGGVSRRQT
ncbi:MAG TPA: hypothetical protein VGD99_05470 [Anaerolineae bacterium]|jgi:hypothetical protein